MTTTQEQHDGAQRQDMQQQQQQLQHHDATALPPAVTLSPRLVDAASRQPTYDRTTSAPLPPLHPQQQQGQGLQNRSSRRGHTMVEGGVPHVPFGATPQSSSRRDSHSSLTMTLSSLSSSSSSSSFSARAAAAGLMATKKQQPSEQWHHLVKPSSARMTAPSRELQRIAVDDDDVPPLSCKQRLTLFAGNMYRTAMLARVLLMLSWVDVKRRKCAYILGFCAVALVVAVCVVMLSVLGYMPLTLLDIIDSTYGRADLVMYPTDTLGSGSSLNYTALQQLFPKAANNELSYHYPRNKAWVRMIGYKLCNNTMPVVNSSASSSDDSPPPVDWWASGCSRADVCVQIVCAPVVVANVLLYAIDDARERRAGVVGNTAAAGPSQSPLHDSGVVLMRDTAELLGVTRVGQRVVLYTGLDAFVLPIARAVTGVVQEVVLDMRVTAIVDRDKSQFNDGTYVAVVNYATLAKQLSRGLHPNADATGDRDALARVPVYDSAQNVIFMLPPGMRQRVYSVSSFEAMRQSVMSWAMSIVDRTGYNQVLTTTATLNSLHNLALLTMMLNMAFAFVILCLSALCVLLLYSMLRVGVAARVYATGIQRMIGLTRENTVALLVCYVYMFTIPGWLAGLVVGQVLYIFAGRVFKNIGGLTLPTRVAGSSIGWATMAAMVIPLLAAFLPMYTMLCLRLCDALRTTRQHASMVVYTIVNSRTQRFQGSYFGLGIVCAVVCALLYYFLPTAFMNNNNAQMLILYVALLCCMIVGLVFLLLNFLRMIEVTVAYVLLFWERRAVFDVMLKNLSMHRSHNNLTTLMYALSIAFLIAVTIMFNMQIDSIQLVRNRRNGGDVVVRNRNLPLITLATTIASAREQMPVGTIVGVGYAVSPTLSNATNLDDGRKTATSSSYDMGHRMLRETRMTSTTLSALLHTVGRYRTAARAITAVSPSFFEMLDGQYLDVYSSLESCNTYGIAGALYLPENHLRVVMSTASYDALALDSLDSYAVLETQPTVTMQVNDHGKQTLSNNTAAVTLVQPAAVLSSAGSVSMSRFATATGNKDDIVISLSLAAALSNTSMSTLTLTPRKAVVRLHRKADAAYVARVLTAAFANISAVDVDIVATDDDGSNSGGLAGARIMINKFVFAIEIAVLAVCLISLLSSMMTNVLRSAKDVGVLLCIGMTHFQIYRVYIGEAFVLVVSSGMLGVVVGVIVAYTMLMQTSATLQRTMPFVFPYAQVLIMIAVGFVSAVLASISPVHFLLSRPSITAILRFFQE